MFGLFRRSGTPENSPRPGYSGGHERTKLAVPSSDPSNAIKVKLSGELNVGSVLSAKCKMPNGTLGRRHHARAAQPRRQTASSFAGQADSLPDEAKT